MGYNFIIAEDHTLVPQGFVKLLSSVLPVDKFAEAVDGHEVLMHLREKTDWHLIFLDIEMEGLNGIDTLRELSMLDNTPPVIMISMHDDRAQEVSELGAKGYLLKGSDIDEVQEAIYCILGGNTYFTPAVRYTLQMVTEKNANANGNVTVSDNANDNPRLGAREIQVLKHICSGKTNRQIASTLYIGIDTVKTHRKNLMKKANAINVTGLMSFAIKRGYVKVYSPPHPKR